MSRHAPRFLKLVAEAKSRIRETTAAAVNDRLVSGKTPNLIDVREESEYARDHLPGALHLGKGIIERDIETRFSDTDTELIVYCGGGFRSALVADALTKMGYTKVISMDGGIRRWRDAGYPLEPGTA